MYMTFYTWLLSVYFTISTCGQSPMSYNICESLMFHRLRERLLEQVSDLYIVYVRPFTVGMEQA